MPRKLTIYSRYDASGASSRLRHYAYEDSLREAGIEVDFQPLFDGNYLKNFYRHFRKPFFYSLFSILRRFFAVLHKMPEQAIVEYELLPYFPAWFELRILRNTQYILNFDDDVWDKYRRFFWLRGKYDKLVKNAAGVIVANQFLLTRVAGSNPNSIVIPTVVDLEPYSTAPPNKFDYFTLVWIGNPSTYRYLLHAAGILREIAKKVNFELLVLAGKNLAKHPIPGVRMRFEELRDAAEADILRRCHVGIMVLPPKEKSASGKSAYKIIQYIAAGLPVVCSPSGENSRLLEKSKAGIIATTPREWAEKIQLLAYDENFYRSFVENCRLVAPEYSLQKYRPILTDFVLKNIF